MKTTRQLLPLLIVMLVLWGVRPAGSAQTWNETAADTTTLAAAIPATDEDPAVPATRVPKVPAPQISKPETRPAVPDNLKETLDPETAAAETEGSVPAGPADIAPEIAPEAAIEALEMEPAPELAVEEPAVAVEDLPEVAVEEPAVAVEDLPEVAVEEPAVETVAEEAAPVVAPEMPAVEIEPLVEEPETAEPASETLEPIDEAGVDALAPIIAPEELGGEEMVPVGEAPDPVIEEVLPEAAEEITPIVLAPEEGMEEETAELTEEQPDTNLITVTLDKVPLRNVVQMFTRISGANIIASGTNLQGSVTVNLEDVEWKPALTAILDMHGLALIEKIPDTEVYSIVPRPPDAPEPQLIETFFLKYARVSDVHKVIKPLLGGGSAVQYPSRNGMIVRATATTLKDIKEVIKTIDQPRKQVFIEAKFVELNDSAIRNLGVNWGMLQNFSVTAAGLKSEYEETHRRSDISSRSSIGSQSMAWNRGFDLQNNQGVWNTDMGTYQYGQSVGESMVRGNNVTMTQLDEGKMTMDLIVPFESEEIRSAVLTMSDLKLVLSALKETDGVDVVSNPKIIVANEETATIHIGERVPNIKGETTTPESGAPVTTYVLDPDQKYFDFGIDLNVTPTVNTEDNITVKIEPSLRRFVRDKVAPDGITFPVTAEKTIQTMFTLQNKHTVAIGGLTESQDREAIKKVPLLGDIPLIGKYLFSHTSKTKTQNETIIFVTVGLANPDTLIREDGIPENGRLIHKHMAQRELESVR